MEEETLKEINEKIEQTLKRIRQIRLKKGYSLESMGSSMGIAETTYRNTENHLVGFTVKNLFKIAFVLNVPVSELIGEKPQHESHQRNHDDKEALRIQELAEIYQENKGLNQSLRESYETHIKHLQEEIVFLRSQLSERGAQNRV